eukprot:m.116198 g.116198  ORF g.116198 m.116198 type:complete len:975 (-) comp23025_c0_seq2:57-2981(-)
MSMNVAFSSPETAVVAKRHADALRAKQLEAWKKRQAEETPTDLSSRTNTIKFPGSVALLSAATEGDEEDLKEQLARGVHPDSANADGLTALHQVCIDDRPHLAEVLLNAGANVNAQDNEKWTPLHAAASCGMIAVVKTLLQHGADVAAINVDNQTPLDLAQDCDDDNYDVIRVLRNEMKARAINDETLRQLKAVGAEQMLSDVQKKVEKGEDINLPFGEDLATLLHIASANGYYEVVDFLIKQGAKLDPQDRDLWTPLHAAVHWNNKAVAQRLIDAGADVFARTLIGETIRDLVDEEDFSMHALVNSVLLQDNVHGDTRFYSDTDDGEFTDEEESSIEVLAQQEQQEKAQKPSVNSNTSNDSTSDSDLELHNEKNNDNTTPSVPDHEADIDQLTAKQQGDEEDDQDDEESHDNSHDNSHEDASESQIALLVRKPTLPPKPKNKKRSPSPSRRATGSSSSIGTNTSKLPERSSTSSIDPKGSNSSLVAPAITVNEPKRATPKLLRESIHSSTSSLLSVPDEMDCPNDAFDPVETDSKSSATKGSVVRRLSRKTSSSDRLDPMRRRRSSILRSGSKEKSELATSDRMQERIALGMEDPHSLVPSPRRVRALSRGSKTRGLDKRSASTSNALATQPKQRVVRGARSMPNLSPGSRPIRPAPPPPTHIHKKSNSATAITSTTNSHKPTGNGGRRASAQSILTASARRRTDLGPQPQRRSSRDASPTPGGNPTTPAKHKLPSSPDNFQTPLTTPASKQAPKKSLVPLLEANAKEPHDSERQPRSTERDSSPHRETTPSPRRRLGRRREARKPTAYCGPNMEDVRKVADEQRRQKEGSRSPSPSRSISPSPCSSPLSHSQAEHSPVIHKKLPSVVHAAAHQLRENQEKLQGYLKQHDETYKQIMLLIENSKTIAENAAKELEDRSELVQKLLKTQATNTSHVSNSATNLEAAFKELSVVNARLKRAEAENAELQRKLAKC